MFAQIRCSNPGHAGRMRAGRHFANGSTYRMEVIETKVDVDKHGNGPTLADGALDMERIDLAGLEKIKADPCFSVLEGGATDSQLSQAAFDELRIQLKAALGELADAKIQIADLHSQLDEATKPIKGKKTEPEK